MEIREAGHEKKWEANGEGRKCTRATTTHHLVALGVCAQLGDWAPGRISTRSFNPSRALLNDKSKSHDARWALELRQVASKELWVLSCFITQLMSSRQ